MALNAVMLNNASKQPVPLPEEKQYLRIDGLEAVLHPMSNTTTLNASAKPLKAAGSIYVTSQRVIFVSDAPPSTLAASGNTELVSLSCNLSHFQDGRLVQPWLSPNYYEAIVLPQPGGRLDSPNNLKIHFVNGRAYEFYEALEEAKRRYEEVRGRGRVAEEPLPLYEAGPSKSMPQDSIITQDDASAANCARRAEREEASTAVQRASGDNGLPPAYESAAGRS